MMRFLVFSALAAMGVGAVVAYGQVSVDPDYRPAVPPPSVIAPGGYGYGYGYGGYGANTPAGAALQGLGSAISAAGDYNLATSAAAVNLTEAQRRAIQNRQEWTETYFAMRATNRAAREAERVPRPTMEQLARIAARGAPTPLSPSEYDQITGTISWPKLLQIPVFAGERAAVEEAFSQHASAGGMSFSNQMEVRAAADSMMDELQARIREVPPSDYIASRKFLESLVATATNDENR